MTTETRSGQPKYFQVVEEIRRQLRSGELQSGDRLPSLSEAYEQWGISRTTMERAHALLEKDGLIVRQHGRGTFVAERRPRVTGNIGLLGFRFRERPQHPYWLHLMRGMQEASHKASLEMLILNPDVEAIPWEKVDGVLICSGHPPLLQSLPPCMPCVTLVHRVAETLAIVADEYQGQYDATRHLLDLGHRRIAIASGSELRLAGYRAALQDAGIEPNAEWARPVFIPQPGQSDYRDVGYATVEQWLKEPRTLWTGSATGCTALLAHNDDFAIGAIEALHEAGRRVPRDVSVVGFDGTEVTRYFAPQLSTVQMPLEEIGRLGVEALHGQIEEGAAGSQTIVLPVMFKAGGSSAPVNTKSKPAGKFADQRPANRSNQP